MFCRNRAKRVAASDSAPRNGPVGKVSSSLVARWAISAFPAAELVPRNCLECLSINKARQYHIEDQTKDQIEDQGKYQTEDHIKANIACPIDKQGKTLPHRGPNKGPTRGPNKGPTELTKSINKAINYEIEDQIKDQIEDQVKDHIEDQINASIAGQIDK